MRGTKCLNTRFPLPTQYITGLQCKAKKNKDTLPGEQFAWLATISAYLLGSATSDHGLSPDPDISIAL